MRTEDCYEYSSIADKLCGPYNLVKAAFLFRATIFIIPSLFYLIACCDRSLNITSPDRGLKEHGWVRGQCGRIDQGKGEEA